jgi:hypothetical protein
MDLLDRRGSSPARVDRLTLGTWYCIACRNADETDLARDLRHWMLVVCYTGRDELRVGDALGAGQSVATQADESPISVR